ncbi:MAG TPA: hypothetical protein VKA21_07605, partial [Candidatus Binatia bacterium]|nr:hypothetical protein [Candidatus Binatia bacterium]
MRVWAVPGLAVAIMVLLPVLSAADLIAPHAALAGTVAAALVLLLYVGLRPLFLTGHRSADRGLAAALALVWF